MSEYNILSHTTTTTLPCDEYVMREDRIQPGGVCISKNTMNKLTELASKYSKDDKSKPIPIRDYELMPYDGSEYAKVIRELAAVYGCDSELCVLYNEEVINLIGKKQWKIEVDRFKTIGPRYKLSGTCGHHQDDILRRWSRIFTNFYPVLCSYYIKDHEKDVLSSISITDIMSKNSNITTIGGPITISTVSNANGEEGGYHSVCIFVDLRHSTNITIEYFDSGSAPIKPVILKWMERERSDILNTYKDKKVETIIVNNRMIHQTETTSCGMFILIYIRKRLEGIPPEMFAEYKIPDSFAIDFRRHVYAL